MNDVSPDDLKTAARVLGLSLSESEAKQAVGAVKERLESLAGIEPPPNELASPKLFVPWLQAKRNAEPGDTAKRPLPPLPKLPERPLPASEIDIAFGSLLEQAAWIRSGALTSEKLTRLSLKRLEAVDRTLHCVITLCGDQAIEKAREADAELAAGSDRGLLHGIPYGMKDIVDTAGIRTTWGAAPYRERVPDSDAWITRRLDHAGAVMLAKLSCGALAYGDRWFGEQTRNPWKPDSGSSGSSAGSAAAVAAGAVALAVGTETYGSIVSPSMVCGTVGLRPTFGTVPRTGVMALSASFDKVGPITRTVDDALAALAVFAGADASDPESLLAATGREDAGTALAIDSGGLDGLRVGYVTDDLDDEGWFGKGEAVIDLLSRQGATLVPVHLPESGSADLMTAMVAEAAAHHQELTLNGQDDELSWQEDAAWPNTFRAIALQSAVIQIQLERRRTEVVRSAAQVFEALDAFVGPTFHRDLVALTNLSGHPAIVVPIGIADGPACISLCGPWFGESRMADVARVIEEWARFTARRPPE